jgi:hypothetical protein
MSLFRDDFTLGSRGQGVAQLEAADGLFKFAGQLNSGASIAFQENVGDGAGVSQVFGLLLFRFALCGARHQEGYGQCNGCR